MKNEGLRNGIIELTFATVMFFLSIVLNTRIFSVVLVVVLVCLFFVSVWQKRKKRAFPVYFYKPDPKLCSSISDYYGVVKYEIESENQNNSWQYFVVIPPYVIIVGVLIYWTQKYHMFEFMPMILIIIFCVVFTGMFLMNYNVARKLEIADSMDCEVAKVEFYDATYDHHGKTTYTTYYVFVRENGETMKLKVAYHVFNYVASHQSGEGYLIKHQKGNGVFDVFDFMPER